MAEKIRSTGQELLRRAVERAKQNDRTEAGYERELAELYAEAARRIQTEVAAVYGRYAKENSLTNAEAGQLLKGEDFTSWRKSIRGYLEEAEKGGGSATLRELSTLAAKSRISRKEELLSGIYRNLLDLAGEHNETMERQLRETFLAAYERTAFDVQATFGVAFNVSKVDERQLRRILSHPWSGKTFSKRIWDDTDQLAVLARRELTIGFAKGASVQEMAKRIDGVMKKGEYAAVRLVRTESSYFAAEGELQSYQEMGVQEYRFLGGGCEDCLRLSGRTFSVKDARAGVNLPPIHPNCRCTIVAVPKISLFKNRPGASPLKGNLKFEEWKKKYLQEAAEGRGDLSAPEYRFRTSPLASGNTTKERLTASRAIAKAPKKVQEALRSTIIEVGKPGTSQYDHANDILFVAKGASEGAVAHELGHLVDKKLVDQSKKKALADRLLKGVKASDFRQEIWYSEDKGSGGTEIWLLNSPMLASDYQGRAYIQDPADAFDENGRVRPEVFLELISEPFRMYQEEREALKKKSPEFYRLIKEAVDDNEGEVP